MSFQVDKGVLRRIGQDFLRYATMGGCAALCDFGTFFLLNALTPLHPLACSLISRPLGGVVSFALHKNVTFQNRGAAGLQTEMVRFAALWVASYAVSASVFGLYFGVFGWAATLSKIGAEGAAGLFAFLANRHWTFRPASVPSTPYAEDGNMPL